MLDELASRVAVLENPKSGWASRREAAELLGQVANTAAAALYRHRNDADVDVRYTVEKACSTLERTLQRARTASSTSAAYSLEDLVNSLRKPGSVDVRNEKNRYMISIRLQTGRQQTVYVERTESEDRMVRVVSFCAPYRTDMPAAWMLRANGRFAQAALALVERGNEEWVAVLNNFIEGQITPQEMKAAVKKVALYADWVEKKLIGKDMP